MIVIPAIDGRTLCTCSSSLDLHQRSVSQHKSNSYIVRVGAIMLGFTLLSGLAAIGVGYLAARIAAGVGRDLRGDIFRKMESFSGAEFDQSLTASLITRSTNDITQVQTVMTFLVRLVFYAPILG